MSFSSQFRRDATAALSVANLTFVRTWNELLTYTKEQAFFFRDLPTFSQSVAAIINMVGLSILILSVIRLMRLISQKRGYGWAMSASALITLPALNSLQVIASAAIPAFTPRLLWSGLPLEGKFTLIALLCVTSYVLWRWPGPILATAAALSISLVWLIPLEAAGILWHLATDQRTPYTVTHLAPRLPDSQAPPVLVLLIDELDYRLLFEDRPPGLKLPEFDRLRNAAFSAECAFSSSTKTQVSVPSLLTGKRYSQTYTAGPDQFSGETTSGAPARPIRGEDTVFFSVREMGINTTVIGWYLPYCRIFASVLSACTWFDLGSRINVEGNSFLRDLARQAQAPYETASFSPFPQSILAAHRMLNFEGIRAAADRVLAEPSPGFVFIHHMATHAPYVYDRINRTFTKRNAPVSGYTDALALADLTLGDFRKTMENAGSWDRAVVLVTSDHSFRLAKLFDGKSDARVPWILKMPGLNTRIDYPTPMHTIITRQLLEAILHGEVRTQADAAEWVRSQESRVYAESEGKMPQAPIRQ